MPRACTICSHEQRPEIEEALVTGYGSLQMLAKRYGVSRGALSRHKAHIKRDIDRHESKHAATLLERGSKKIEAAADSLAELIGMAKEHLVIHHEETGGIAPGQLKAVAMATRELTMAYERMVKVTGAGDGKRDEQRGAAVVIIPAPVPPGSPCHLDKQYWIDRGFTGPPLQQSPHPVETKTSGVIDAEVVPIAPVDDSK